MVQQTTPSISPRLVYFIKYLKQWNHFFSFCTICIVSIMLLLTQSHAAQLTLPKDANGWTIFTPSTDSRIMYVSADGNDSTGVIYTSSNHPTWNAPFEPGTVKTFATYSAAYANTRDGYPDWILIRRGDTLKGQVIDRSFRSGRSATEPFLVAAYGSSGLSPVFKTGTLSAIYKTTAFQWVAFSGLNFYCNSRDPESADYVGTSRAPGFYFRHDSGITQGLLIEGCKFRSYSEQVMGPVYGVSTTNGVTVRRTVIINSYPEDGAYAQGFYSANVENLVVDECILDHNGWYDDYQGTIGVARSMSHNIYAPNLKDSTFSNNISSRSSHTGFKFTATYDSYNIRVINNLSVANTIGVDMGTNNPSNVERFFDPEISNNVFTYTGYDNPTSYTVGWGLALGGWSGGSIYKNLFLDNMVSGITNETTFSFQSQCQNLTVSNNIDLGQASQNFSVRFEKALETDVFKGITFSDNNFEVDSAGDYFVIGDSTDGLTFTNNTWYSPNSSIAFGFGGISRDKWLSSVEPTASFTQKTYKDRSRTLLTYLTSIGKTPTLENFYTLIGAQDRYNWDTRFTASYINSWIRNGFELNSIPVPGGFHRSN